MNTVDTVDKVDTVDTEDTVDKVDTEDTKDTEDTVDSNDSGDYVNPSYEYCYNKTVKTPYLKNLNKDMMPAPLWSEKLNMFANNPIAQILIDAEKSGFLKWISMKVHGAETFLKQVFYAFMTKEKKRAEELKDFEVTFLDPKPEKCGESDGPKGVIENFCHLDKFQTSIRDEVFCAYRLSGPNPTSIKLCTIEDLVKMRLDEKELNDMKILLNKKQLFVVDFSQMADFPAGTKELPFEDVPKQVFGSIALFKLEKDHLEAVCITVFGQDKKQSKVFHPSTNPDADCPWKIAKCIFQSNDAVFHEAFAHLAGTHLVLEAFLVATYRRLRTDHPLYVLLDKHLEGTAFINSVAEQSLVSDGGAVDLLVSQAISNVRVAVVDFLAGVTSRDMTFPARIEARGVDADQLPGVNFPYRDDGMLLWNAILRWVTGYLEVFYKDHQAVRDDKCISAWLQELKSDKGGKIKWIESLGFDSSNARDHLSQVVASIIFIASVDHAAVNFPQRTLMQFTGAFPLAIYASEEVVFNEDANFQDYMSLYPPIDIAHLQANVLQLLGGIRHTRLGHYDSGKPTGQYFLDKVGKTYGDSTEVVAALTGFQDELANIESEIKQRNKTRDFPYVEMLPSVIPQSINI